MNADEIRKCSDDELSRVIAEALEPKPAYEFVAARTIENAAAMMRLKFWRPEFFDYYDAFGHNKYRPVPRDFVNDPAMSMMLLEKMAAWGGEPLVEHITAGWGCMVFKQNENHASTKNLIEITDCKTLGRAICEAYARSIQKEQV